MRPEIPSKPLRPAAIVAVPFLASVLVLAAARPATDRGKEVFDTVCAACHTLTPPPLDAPPMLMIAGHYVRETGSEAEAREAMKAWIPDPDPIRSLLPEDAVEEFGTMVALPLPEEDLEAVVAYIFSEWASADRPEPMGPRCNGDGCGRDMQHRHGAAGDSTVHGMAGGGMRHRHDRRTGCAAGMCRQTPRPGADQ